MGLTIIDECSEITPDINERLMEWLKNRKWKWDDKFIVVSTDIDNSEFAKHMERFKVDTEARGMGRLRRTNYPLYLKNLKADEVEAVA